MKFLNCGLSGQEPLMVHLPRAIERVKAADKFGVMDALSDFFGVKEEPYIRPDGIAVVPIKGVLGVGLSRFDEMTGGVDMWKVSDQIDALASNPAVRGIAFDISSPGGTVLGTPELAEKVASLSVPTLAYTRDLMASAAIYIGSQADRVISAKSAYVGSVGVISIDYSYADYFKMNGIKVEITRSTEFKAPNAAGEGYTEAQKESENKRVVAMYDEFKKAVKSKRTMVADAALDGTLFTGAEAARLRLITGIAPTLDEAIASAF